MSHPDNVCIRGRCVARRLSLGLLAIFSKLFSSHISPDVNLAAADSTASLNLLGPLGLRQYAQRISNRRCRRRSSSRTARVPRLIG